MSSSDLWSDEVSVACFIADQRTRHQVPHVFSCRLLGVRESWFYKWIKNPVSDRSARQAELDAAVKQAFDASGKAHGSPRVHVDLTDPLPPVDPAQLPTLPRQVSVTVVLRAEDLSNHGTDWVVL